MDTQQDSFGAPPSGLPPLAWLSGLDLGKAGLGGQQDGTFSGAGKFAGGVGAPGAEGMGLDALAALFAAMQAGGDATGAASSAPVGTGTLAQGAGTLGQAGAGPTGGYSVAGQTSGASTQQAAASQASGSMDPLAIIQKILGVAKGGLSAALAAGSGGSAGPGGGGEGGGGGTIGGGGYTTGGTPTASPTVTDFGQAVDIPYTGSQGYATGSYPYLQPGGGMQLGQGYATAGAPNAGADIALVNQYGQAGNTLTGQQQLIQSLLEQGMTPDQIQQAFSLSGNITEPGQGFEQMATGGSGAPGLPGTNWGGVAQGGLSGALGLLNILQGAEGGNVQQGIGGGLQGAGGLAQILMNSPQLAQALGLTPDMIKMLGSSIGGLGGLLGLAGGVQGLASGDSRAIAPAISQLAGGGLATYQALQSAFPQIFGTAVSGASTGLSALSALGAIYGLMGQGDPTGGAQTGAALTGLAATAPGTLSAVGMAPALAGTIGGTLGAAAPVIAAVVAALGNAEEMRAREAGWRNNPIKGGLYSAANEGTANVGELMDRIQQAGGMQSLDNAGLEKALQYSLNNLMPYYQTAEGGKGAVRASDTVTGTLGQQGITTDSPEAYTQRFNAAQQQTVGLLNELLNQGVSYGDIGKMELGFNPAYQSLDMANPWEQFYQPQASKWQQEAANLVGQSGIAGADILDPMQALMGTDALNNPQALAQFNTLTQAFGGPTAYWLARLGIAPQQQAQALFDPLRNLRGRTQTDLASIVAAPVQQAQMEAAQRYQDFTSGGG